MVVYCFGYVHSVNFIGCLHSGEWANEFIMKGNMGKTSFATFLRKHIPINWVSPCPKDEPTLHNFFFVYFMHPHIPKSIGEGSGAAYIYTIEQCVKGFFNKHETNAMSGVTWFSTITTEKNHHKMQYKSGTSTILKTKKYLHNDKSGKEGIK